METGEKTEKELEKEDQMSFVRKVLGIVALQLSITFIFAICGSINYNFGAAAASLPCFITSISVYLASLIALFCSKGLRHSFPGNYAMLTIVTV